jgi:hypothetical protein
MRDAVGSRSRAEGCRNFCHQDARLPRFLLQSVTNRTRYAVDVTGGGRISAISRRMSAFLEWRPRPSGMRHCLPDADLFRQLQARDALAGCEKDNCRASRCQKCQAPQAARSQSSGSWPLRRTPVMTKVIRFMSTSARPWRNALAASRDFLSTTTIRREPASQGDRDD